MENFDEDDVDYCSQEEFDQLDSKFFDLEQAFNDLLLIIVNSDSIEDVKNGVKQKLSGYLPSKYK